MQGRVHWYCCIDSRCLAFAHVIDTTLAVYPAIASHPRDSHKIGPGPYLFCRSPILKDEATSRVFLFDRRKVLDWSMSMPQCCSAGLSEADGCSSTLHPLCSFMVMSTRDLRDASSSYRELCLADMGGTRPLQSEDSPDTM